MFVVAAAVAVFWRTAFPSITWWDSSSYSLAAATLGVSSSPGSLLLMLLGWPVAHLPLGASPAYRLNLFAGALAATAAVLVYLTALQLHRIMNANDPGERTQSRQNTGVRIGAGAGALAFVFGSTLWEYGVMFTPYILTAVFTAALLYVLMRWWEDALHHDGWKWLAIAGLLFGLDFSVHRTNALLIPAAMVFVLTRSPRALIAPRNIISATTALFAGLLVQTLIIPIARVTRSEMNFGNPSDWSRFVDYVSLSQSGGSFFVKIYPRNAELFRVQIPDFLSAMSDNALHWNGLSSFGGTLPAIAAVIGLLTISRRQSRLAVALLALLVVQAVMTVIFFNIPANYFRSLDRHYLPVWVTIGVFIACGLAWVGETFISALRSQRKLLAVAATVVLLAVPSVQLLDNWKTHDASQRYFAHDYALNTLNSLPPNAIYFTVGDNDTFPLMYMQGAEGVRPDVRLVNLAVLHYNDYADQRRALDSSFPLSLSSAARREVRDKPWTDTLVTLLFSGDNASFGLAADTQTLDSATFRIKPMWGEKMTLGEISLVDIVRTNQWRRPLTFSITGSRSAMAWLEPYGRLEGLHWRIVPVEHAAPNAEAIRAGLFSRFSYRGYADSAVVLDDVAAQMGTLYYSAFSELMELDRARGDDTACRNATRQMQVLLPPARITASLTASATTGGSAQEFLAAGCP